MTSRVLMRRNELHLMRKSWHVLCGLFSLSLYFLFEIPVVQLRWVALAATIIAFTVDILRMKNEAFNKRVVKVLAPVMRASELKSFSGLPFYALGMCASLFFYKESIAILSIFFLVFADPIASLIGVKFGKDKILPNKSLQGTIAAFITCALITFIGVHDFDFDMFTIMTFSLLCGIVGSLSELFSAFNIDDNLTIPIMGGGGITLLNLYFQFF